MKSLNELLDAIKERRNLETDSALASALGVKRQTVSNWRQGRNTPDAVACATIAGLSGEPLARVIGLAGEQRAISQEEKAVWRKLAASVGVALIAVLATLPSVAHAATPALHAASSHAGELMLSAYALCEIKDGAVSAGLALLLVPAATTAGPATARNPTHAHWRTTPVSLTATPT